uniref:Uncharacterized protein n=1 Tax=Rhizophora mucronata TaxID=61149 RepID=A0A2P2NIA3_RHIMU
MRLNSPNCLQSREPHAPRMPTASLIFEPYTFLPYWI